MSDTFYLALPPSGNPRVMLAIGNERIAEKSFRLYQPFSFSARILKLIMKQVAVLFPEFLMVYCGKYSRSPFVIFLENKLGLEIITSVYFSTDKDKVVLQVQNKAGEIIGYIKAAITQNGNRKLENELRGIEVMQLQGLCNFCLFDTGEFKGFRYIFTSEIIGESKPLNKIEVIRIIKLMNKHKKYSLSMHPGICSLKQELILKKKPLLALMLHKMCENIKEPYFEAYEHGDFTPWNIMTSDNKKFGLLDFEYFNEKGLEYMDLIKYYFQTATLLKKMSGEKLVRYVLAQVDDKNAPVLFIIFLLKEIVRRIEEEMPYDELISYLKIIESVKQ